MRFFLFGLLCLFAITTASAQVGLGVKAGWNASTLDKVVIPLDGSEEGETIYDAWKVRYQAGFWLRIPVGEQINIRPELLYIQKDWNFGKTNPLDAHTEMKFLSVPVLLQYRWGNLHLAAGPELTYLVDHENYFEGEAVGENFQLRDVDFGLGLNADLMYTIGRLEISFRYARDITSFNEFAVTDLNGEPIENVEHRFHTFQLSVGYDILGKE